MGSRMLEKKKKRKALITEVELLQSDLLSRKSAGERKDLGQFFTSSITAEYMASLLKKVTHNSVRILDPGAGNGILTAATALQALETGSTEVHAVLYELDTEAVPYIQQALSFVCKTFSEKNSSFTYEVRNEDFVLSRPDQDLEIEAFDLAVINPPYFKYGAKTSPYAKAVADIYKGDPNIYASFMAIVLATLTPGGQMVSITPRSFTNGLYFKWFRKFLLRESAIDLIHIFRDRNKVFKNKESDVLQENIICRFVKGEVANEVVVRTSDGNEEIYDAEEQRYPFSLIVDPENDEDIIRIPESSHDARILKQAEVLPTTFTDAGYQISTGRVVEHRTRSFITSENGQANTVPLYRPHNITPLKTKWDGSHKKDVSFALNDKYDKHTIPDGVYVLLKRFSSKDEKRRLVSSVHIPNNHNKVIGFGNKTNYIRLGCHDEKLTDVEAFGLGAVFNSTFMDRYFRCISGNTQVNSTEIRVMRFPSREQIIEIGQQTIGLANVSGGEIDLIVNQTLGITDLVRTDD